MFFNCSSLISIDITNFNCDTLRTTNQMENMFKGCTKLKIENLRYRDFKIRNQLLVDLK